MTRSAALDRSRAVIAQATAMQARAVTAVDGAVAIVSEVVARHGHLLHPQTTDAEVPPKVISRVFTSAGVSEVRRLVTRKAGDLGLTGRFLQDFVLAVQELMTNAVRHGGGWGRLRLYRDGFLLVCVVTDHGPGFTGDPAGPEVLPSLESEGGRGLWLARRAVSSLQISTSPFGVRATVTMKLHLSTVNRQPLPLPPVRPAASSATACASIPDGGSPVKRAATART
ncbi:ATP-binding protein [Actinoplanes sp. GCM10030250]|uniref:ATP-binding protein n=1 Tax=Actinoplanes sp. GCM10030250 TaxID=3273376 RepID=UPI003606066E